MKKLVIKNCRGSHVGVMISFMIFVAFVLFVVVILEPALTTDVDKKSMLETIEKKLIDASSSEMIVATISINSVSSSCVSLSSFISDFNAYEGIVIKNSNKVLIPSSISSSDYNTLYIKRNSNSENFLKIYSSDALPESSYETISCTAIIEGSNYDVITKRENYVFENKIIDLINDYENYESFKSNLNLPENTESS